MRTIEVLVGMIASGKSSYARRRAQRGASIVCHDDLTEMLHGEYRYESGLREYYRAAEERLAGLTLNFGRDVVVDRTHLTRESRLRWLDWARSRTWREFPEELRVVAVVFPLLGWREHALRRFEADPRGRSYDDWCVVAQHHRAQAEAEPLSAAEGFDLIVEAPPWTG